MDDKGDNGGVKHEQPEQPENKSNEEEPMFYDNEEPQNKLNKDLEELRKRLKNQYPDFERFEAMYNHTWDINYRNKSIEELSKILMIITNHEYYSFMFSYDIHKVTYNLDKIYSDYFNQINKDRDAFINDLIYLFRIGYASLFIPDQNTKYFNKPNVSFKYSNPYPFLENLCKIYPLLDNGKTDAKAIVYFTIDGDRYRKGDLVRYQLQEVIKKQDQLDEVLEKLKDDQDKLRDDIKNHSKEIISIIAIILAFAPVIAINITAVQKSLTDLLIVNGCLILGITTIFSVVNVAFFKLEKKHRWLSAPLALGILLIVLGLYFPPKQVSPPPTPTPAAAPTATTVPAPIPTKP